MADVDDQVWVPVALLFPGPWRRVTDRSKILNGGNLCWAIGQTE